MDGWLDTIPIKKHDEWFDELRQMRADLLQMSVLQGIPILKEPEQDESLSEYLKDFTITFRP
jgi:2-phosphoglycerate kinase